MEEGAWIMVVDNGIIPPAYWNILAYNAVSDFHRLEVKAEVINKNIWKQYACTPYDLASTKHSTQLIVIGKYGENIMSIMSIILPLITLWSIKNYPIRIMFNTRDFTNILVYVRLLKSIAAIDFIAKDYWVLQILTVL